MYKTLKSQNSFMQWKWLVLVGLSRQSSGKWLEDSIKYFKFGKRFCKKQIPSVCLKKKKNRSYLFEFILKLEFWNIKSQFSFQLLIFLGHDMTIMRLSFLWTTNSYFICGQTSMLNLDIQIKVSFKSQNVKKKWFCPSIHFSNKYK